MNTQKEKKMEFDAGKYLTDIKGKQYLEAKWRLVWFREVHPDWSIESEVVEHVPGGALVKATIKDANGRVMAQAHKMETKSGFADYMEKAETGAIARALAMCGFGTQFAEEFEEGTERIADAPVAKPAKSFEEAEKELGGKTIMVKEPNDPATDKQMNLLNLVLRGGQLAELYEEMYGKPLTPEHPITKGQASEMIERSKEWLKAKATQFAAPKAAVTNEDAALFSKEEPF